VKCHNAVVCVVCLATPVSDQYCVASEATADEALASRQLELCTTHEAFSSECGEVQLGNSEQTSSVNVELCSYAANGYCPYADQCVYVHGDVCDLCHSAVLSPFDLDQQQRHTEVSM